MNKSVNAMCTNFCPAACFTTNQGLVCMVLPGTSSLGTPDLDGFIGDEPWRGCNPNSSAFKIGERVVRPCIDHTVSSVINMTGKYIVHPVIDHAVWPTVDIFKRIFWPQSSSIDACSAALRYSWSAVIRVFSAVDGVASRIFGVFPGAQAIEDSTGWTGGACDDKRECSEIPALVEPASLLIDHEIQSSETSASLSRYSVSLRGLSNVLQTLESSDGEEFSSVYRDLVHNATIDSTLARRKEKNRHESPSVVRLPEQNFVLAPLPRKEHTAAYFCLCLKQNVRVFVSAHEVSDANVFEYGKFWDQSVLAQLPHSELDGWKLEVQNVSVLAGGTERNTKGEIPRLIETTIIATHDLHPSRTMTHLYYEGWVDRTAASDESLLQKLLDRIETLSPDAQIPIAINCHAGRGRTLNVAAAYFFRKKIAFARSQGLDDGEIDINFPELIFRIHQQRDLDTRSKPPREYAFAMYKQVLAMTNAYAKSSS